MACISGLAHNMLKIISVASPLSLATVIAQQPHFMEALSSLGLQLTVADPFHFTIKNRLGKPIFEYTYLPQYYAGIHSWLGFVEMAQMKAVIEYLVSQSEQNHLPAMRCISDFSLCEGGFSEAMEWFANEILPRIIPLGFRGEAIILPKDFYAELTIDDFKDLIKEIACEHVYFDNLVEGMAWLEAHKAKKTAKVTPSGPN